MTNRRAFTLIELLVAAAIMAMAVAGIGGVLAAAIRIWHAAHTHVRLETGAFLGLAAWERDIMNAQPCRHAPFQGSVDAVTIPVPAADATAGPPGFVRYYFDRAERTVRRQAWTSSTADPLAQASEKWIEHVADLRLQYLADPAETASGAVAAALAGPWDPVWNHLIRLPRAVRITLTLSTPGAPALSLERTLVLPVGVR